MSRSLLLLIPVLAAGVAVGFAAGAGSAGLPAPPPTLASVVRPEPERVRPEPPLVDEESPLPSRQPCRGVVAAPGSIHGFVRTPLGEPVPGVNVSTEVRGGDHPRKTETRTGTDGTYELSSLPDAAYYLSAKAEGLRVEAMGRGPTRPGGRLDFVASPVESVTVRVVLPDGTEPAEAEISWTAPASTESTGSWRWTPVEPAVDLPPGPWILSATAGDDEEYDSEQVTFTPPAPGEPRRAMLALRGRAGLLCRLRAEGGAWSGTIQLRAARVPDDGDRDPERLLRGANSSRSFCAAKSAVAFLGDLRSGMWCVGATSVSGNVLGHSFAEVGPDLRVLEIAVAEPRRSDYLVVRAMDPRGGRATDFTGRLRPACGQDYAHPGRGRPRGAADELPDGSYRLWFPEVEHGGSEWVLDATAEGCAIERRLFTRTEASEVPLRFGEPACVDLGIDWTEDGPDFVRVRLVPPEGPELSAWLSHGESERIGPVLPGIFRVFVETRVGEVSCTPGEITLAPGLNSAVLRLGLLHGVVVAFGEARAAMTVTVCDDDGRTFFDGEVGLDGDLHIGSLVPGAYRLWLMDRQRGSMAFTVPGPSRFLFVPDRVDCLRVVIQNGSGLLARWGLRDGDLVAAVDGTEIPNAGTALALLELAATRERSVLTVLRNGDRFDLEVLSPAFDPVALGGSLVASAR